MCGSETFISRNKFHWITIVSSGLGETSSLMSEFYSFPEDGRKIQDYDVIRFSCSCCFFFFFRERWKDTKHHRKLFFFVRERFMRRTQSRHPIHAEQNVLECSSSLHFESHVHEGAKENFYTFIHKLGGVKVKSEKHFSFRKLWKSDVFTSFVVCCERRRRHVRHGEWLRDEGD